MMKGRGSYVQFTHFVVGLAIMLLCMMRTKWGPFVCMLLASLAIGIGCGLGTDKTIASIVDGFAKTCKISALWLFLALF